jgi:hypothetical protein
MTNDGRVFFSTPESLVPQDTDEAIDVYEYSGGRPQLISSGTGGGAPTVARGLTVNPEIPGLIGVSANGTDAYFSTFEPLVSEDHNGNFMRFYDARTNGGFPQPTPAQPCVAAEECHGPGTEAPVAPHIASNGPPVTGGNATAGAHPHHKKHKHHHKKRKRGFHKRLPNRAQAHRRVTR